MRILGVEASFRASGRGAEIIQAIKKCQGSFENISNFIYDFASTGRMSNSEGMLIAALGGASKERADIDLCYLPSRRVDDNHDLKKAKVSKYLNSADGILVSTPVYFGDRAHSTQHLFDQYYNTAGIDSFPLNNKTIGFLSVGAKRNGGQETTNIFGLFDAQSQGAFVVGNGPPTSQYGGTGWAGDKGRILDDDFGLKTAFGTGRKVAQVSSMLSNAQTPAKNRKVCVTVLQSNGNNALTDSINKSLQNNSHVQIQNIDLNAYDLNACIACKICPHPKASGDYYRCIVNDDMQSLMAKIEQTDCLIFSCDQSSTNSLEKLQIFTERTRCIRRNNFRWSNIPIGLTTNMSPSVQSISTLKILSSCLRHNTIIVGPFYQVFYAGKTAFENQPLSTYIDKVLLTAQKVQFYTEKQPQFNNSFRYEPVGYGFTNEQP